MDAPPSYTIRPLTPEDQPILWKMLYYAIHVPEDGTPPEREIVHHPALAKYVRDWGGASDLGFAAVKKETQQPVGVAWTRLLAGENRGFAYVSDTVPQLSIAVLPGHRGQGIGTALLARLLQAAGTRHLDISLSVQSGNPALRLYRRFGFETVRTSGQSLVMIKHLDRLLLGSLADRESIIARERYLQSAVLAAFYQQDGVRYLVFEKRPEGLKRAGEICFPGGHREQGDATGQETAVRETMEELRVARENVEVYGKLGTLITPSGSMIEVYLGKLQVESIESIDFDRTEVERLLKVPLAFFMETPPQTYDLVVKTHPYAEKNGKRLDFPARELALPKRYHQPWGGRDRKVYLYKYADDVIWGITGEIVYEIVKRIKGIT